MGRWILQLLGVLVIAGSFGLWWLADLYGCAYYLGGCNRVLPRINAEAVSLLALPFLLGLGLILLGRRRR